MATLSSEDVISIIALGTVGMLILIGGIALFILVYQKKVLHEKQKQALREMEYQDNMITMQLQSQEQERRRIGADLHDSLGSLLWGAKVNAAFIRQTVDLQGEAETSHNELIEILDQSITTVRRIAWELTPEAFHHAGFSQSVSNLCNQLDGRGMEAKFIESGSYYWNNHDALQAYRIVQELVSNVVKHAKATIVTVSIIWQEVNLEISVQDNGIGFKLDNKRTGVGWWSIEQRAKYLHAEIRIGDSTIKEGTNITLNLPLNYDKGKN
jgi:two-component system, NarL family, sensor kinase